jgi:hypothetical protein
VYEEKRGYPRVVVDSLAEIHKGNEYRLKVILYDISPDGVQLRCNRETAHIIHPTGKFITSKTAQDVILNFSLPVDGKEKKVIAEARIYYFSIVGIDVVAFGAKFKQVEKSSERHINDFIMKSIVPIEEKVLDILETPKSSEDILEHIDDENIDLAHTLNLLHKKKAIVSYEEDKTRKFVKLESAIASIFERLEKIEKRLDKLD